MHTAGENVFKKYKTPSFVSPNSSKFTENIPSMSETSSSKFNSNMDQNVGSSMIEKHTIIFESEVENADNESDAPTESQHLFKSHNNIRIEDNSMFNMNALKESQPLNLQVHDPSNIISENKEEFQNSYRDSKLPVFGKKTSQSDIYCNDVNLEQYEDDKRASKTAFIPNVLNVGLATIQNQEQTEESENKMPDITKPLHTLVDQNTQTEAKQEINSDEFPNKNDEIYLNLNSAEENPDVADIIAKDTNSISKHTLLFKSNEENDNEVESQISEKNYRPEKIDKNFQISPETAPHIDGQKFNDKNLQIGPKASQSSKIRRPIDDHSDTGSQKSQYINREMVKLHNNKDRREKFKSSKEVPGYNKLAKEQKSKDAKTYAQSRYSNKRPFDYKQNSVSDAKSKKSEELKVGSTVGNQANRNIGKRQVFDSMDYRASQSPTALSAGVQVTGLNTPNNEEAFKMYTSNGAQVGKSLENPYNQDIQFVDEGVQAEEPWKDADIQCDLSENNEGIQVDLDTEILSRGISGGSDSNGNPLMTREVHIVDKYSENATQNDPRIDFSCQFSYHTIASTDHIKEEEFEEEEEEEEDESGSFPQPEILSTYHDQLSLSEQERITLIGYKLPDLASIIKKLLKKKRSKSLTFDSTLRDIERRLILVNRPFLPKYIKHKKLRSENASEVSEEMNEEKYYKQLQGKLYSEEDDEEDYPEYILDANIFTNGEERKTKDKPQNKFKGNALVNPSPTFKECDVTRPIKKPTVEDKISKIMDGSYNPDKRNNLNGSRKSNHSNPIRLGDSSYSDQAEDQK